MTEQDGHEMVVARMKALEAIALQEMGNSHANSGYNKTPAELKEELEQRVEKIAGWRN